MSYTRAGRLRAPIVTALGGSALTVAIVVGFGWERASGPAVVTVVASVGYSLPGGRDTDTGDLIGGRPDERQLGIVTQATALSRPCRRPEPVSPATRGGRAGPRSAGPTTAR
jgi:hypothetical protein